ncbi:MAG: hypothetical protein A3E01_18580 [Gammaproteobacteria bacterium RIFCSPHIGHO2_12_FULL_63_22]|nr:MAG: hypothetical protein A3E01_18580 [Gammaproteobacteria bacterium RIFCSPHIGHO2_12_FULL_63_22]
MEEKTMKLVILLLVPAVLLGGCCSHELCARSVEPYANAILPEYEKYVAADPKLNENEAGISEELKAQRARTKEAALRSAQSLKDAIQRLKEQ